MDKSTRRIRVWLVVIARWVVQRTRIVSRVRAVTSKPICVGFGIANAESAKRVAQIADGVIVGSALVSKIASETNAVQQATKFVAGLRTAIDR